MRNWPKKSLAICFFILGCAFVLGTELVVEPWPLADRQAIETRLAQSEASTKLVAEAAAVVDPNQIYAVSPTVLAVEIAAPEVTLGAQIPYRAHAEDKLRGEGDRTEVIRNGQSIGILVGEDQGLLYTYDRVADTPFQLQFADSPASYLIRSDGDSTYSASQSPIAVFRKSKPAAFSQESRNRRSWPAAHTLFLQLPEPISAGQTYQLSFPSLNVSDRTFEYQPLRNRSEAVHVSQLGFRADDTFKVGYLSTWMGSGGGLDYPDNLSFDLIDSRTQQSVYRGGATQRRAEAQLEDPRDRDYTLSEVHQLDFSEFDQPGQYRLCVEGVGCSFDFEIGPMVWQQAFYTAVRGFYHQRSGIAIGPPFSAFTRPRAFHPDEGVEVYQSSAKLLDITVGRGKINPFEALTSGKTDQIVPNAWGGYFDAGDWDRRIQHLAVARSLLELHGLFPDYFEKVSLNLPESANALPDLVDEALWTVDFFERLQTPDGGIRGGIESADHPKPGETSWQDSLTVMAYAPDLWSSYQYAGVAARAAFTLRDYDSPRAERYQRSALRAMSYAEADYRSGRYQIDDRGSNWRIHQIFDERNLAALELYRLTQDSQWHDLFLETSAFQQAGTAAFVYRSHDQREAAFLYARLTGMPVDSQVQRHARAAFLARADELVALTQTTAFGWSRQNPRAPVGTRSSLGSPTGIDTLRAHALTGDERYLQAGISGTQFAAGANPANLVFTTGLGDRAPQNPLIIDQRITRQAPPPGITVYGPADFAAYDDYWILEAIAPTTFPHPKAWPTSENYFDIYRYPMGAEFTVDYMVSAAYTWGYLAAR